MTPLREKTGSFWRKFMTLVGARPDTAPVDSVTALEKFVATRSAYVAQKTLYGYVKTRMGIRYAAMFEDKNMIASLNIAKMHVFAACLADLSIYAVATAVHGRSVPNDFEQGAGAALLCGGIARQQRRGARGILGAGLHRRIRTPACRNRLAAWRASAGKFLAKPDGAGALGADRRQAEKIRH